MAAMRRSKRACAASILPALLAACVLLAACSREHKTSADRAQTPKTLFDVITKDVHVPAAAANGPERLRLQNEAASRYAELVKRFPEESNICAQALRSLGNIYAAQT